LASDRRWYPPESHADAVFVLDRETPEGVGLDDYHLDRLIKVPASEAIGGEATHFTPWLAAHINLLSESLGLGLDLGEEDPDEIVQTHAEVPVGNYARGIQCSTDDGRTIVIENQFDRSDHTHLGQIITYGAGIDADVVVWIAESFAEQHLDALRWLNRRTEEDCGAFAVELAFYRIGESAPAPQLTTLVGPSDCGLLSRYPRPASHFAPVEQP